MMIDRWMIGYWTGIAIMFIAMKSIEWWAILICVGVIILSAKIDRKYGI